jgi:hypothetical protein
VVAVTGILLAAVLAMTGVATSRDESAPAATTAPQMASAVQQAGQHSPRSLVIYVVGSHSEKVTLERDLASWQSLVQQGTVSETAMLDVIVIGPGEEESLEKLAELVPEAETTIGQGATLTLVDLR